MKKLLYLGIQIFDFKNRFFDCLKVGQKPRLRIIFKSSLCFNQILILINNANFKNNNRLLWPYYYFNLKLIKLLCLLNFIFLTPDHIFPFLQKRKIDAVYFYMRSLMSSNPFQSARESLIALFDETRKKVSTKFHDLNELSKYVLLILKIHKKMIKFPTEHVHKNNE